MILAVWTRAEFLRDGWQAGLQSHENFDGFVL